MHLDAYDRCDDSSLESLLEGSLSEEQSLRIERHLETCARCRGRLDDLAAEPDEWREVRECLSDVKATLSTCANDSLNADNLTESSPVDVRALLAPTDDPQMLGRLGPYEISGVIGAGGMGIVLKGFDRALNRFVAVKVLAPHLATTGSARKRFSREAKAAAAVVHDNVVAIHGVSEARGLPYLVMPYIRGQSLQKRLQERGQFPIVEVLRIGRQIAAGLAAAHAQGLVHRDIKPANILLEEGIERLKITDFGLARTANDVDLTQEGALAGTPQYMSPEQARGDVVDARSDLFSLGSLLYALCAGHPPFRADGNYGILRNIIEAAPRKLRALNPEVPDWLEAVIEKLLSKEPAKRFESADEVAQLLEECLAHVQQPTVMPLPSAARQLLQTSTNGGVRRSDRWAVGKAAYWVAGVGLGVVVVAAALRHVGTFSADRTDSDAVVDLTAATGADPGRSDGALGGAAAEDASVHFEMQPLTIGNSADFIRGLQFSRDGRLLAVAASDHPLPEKMRRGAVLIWDVIERRLVGSYVRQAGIRSVALSPTAEWVAFGTEDGWVHVVERSTGREQLREKLGETNPAVAFSPRGTWFAAGSRSDAIALWKVENFSREAISFESDEIPLTRICFSADETKLGGCGGTFPPDSIGGAAAIWDLPTSDTPGGRRLVTVRHSAAVMDVAFDSTGSMFATAGLDSRAVLWDAANGESLRAWRDADSGVVAVRFVGDRVVTLGPKSGIQFRSRDGSEPEQTIEAEALSWTALAESADRGLIAYGGHEGIVRLWDFAANRSAGELSTTSADAGTSAVEAATTSSVGRLVAMARDDGFITVYDAEAGSFLRSFDSRHGRTQVLTFAGDGRELFSYGGDRRIRIWDVRKGEHLLEFAVSGDAGVVTALAAIGDRERIVAGSQAGMVLVWDGRTAKLLSSRPAHDDAVRAIVPFADGKRILTVAADGLARIWDVAGADLLLTCDIHKRPITSAAISSDESVVATGDDGGRVILWNARTGLDRRTMSGMNSAVRGLAFSTNGRALVAAGDDGTLRVWDVGTHRLLQAVTGHAGAIVALGSVAPDADRLITVDAGGAAKLWFDNAPSVTAATGDDQH